MPTVTKDKRQWNVLILFENDDCPLKYYPDSSEGCTLRKTFSKKYPDDTCTLENCREAMGFNNVFELVESGDQLMISVMFRHVLMMRKTNNFNHKAIYGTSLSIVPWRA